MNETQNHITYEYKEVSVSRSQAPFYLDAYKSFGWQEDERFASMTSGSTVQLKLKRDRKLANRTELTRLQKHFEANAADILTMEHAKTSKARLWAFCVGFVGTAFMAGSVFAVTAAPPILWLCILFGILGFAGWIAPYFVYTALKDKKTRQVTPFIEAKTEEIYELCEKGQSLL